MASSTAAPGSTKVVVDIAADLPAVPGDPFQLRQLFTNLLTNAFEALEGSGTVTIRASLAPAADEGEPDHAVIEVRDDGPGVSGDVAERVFNPFFTTKPKGTGLGLSIVRRLVDAHDGHIDLTTPPGGGTCFRVSLPAANSNY
jgi:signal transduction histidine kinase